MVTPLISPPGMTIKWLCSGGFLKFRSVGRPARQNAFRTPLPSVTDSTNTPGVAQISIDQRHEDAEAILSAGTRDIGMSQQVRQPQRIRRVSADRAGTSSGRI